MRAYTRKRDGKVEHVGAHDRTAPPGGLVSPMMAGPVIRGGATLLPLLPIPPLVGDALRRLPGLLSPDRPRPSLLDPPEGERRQPETISGAVQSNPPNQNDGPPGHEAQGSQGEASMTGPGLRPSPDTVEGLRDASIYKGKDGHGTDIWDAGGNEDQRDADLQALRPGPMRPAGECKAIGDLPDGRQVMIRPGSRFSNGEPTLEISHPDGVGANGRPRYVPTDKIRYRSGRG